MHMKLNFKRLMAMFLSIMMVVGMMPTMVFAMSLDDLQDAINNGTGEIVLDGDINENASDPVVIDFAAGGSQSYPTLAEAFAATTTGDEVEIRVTGEYSLSGISGKNIIVTGKTDGVVFTDIGAFNMGGADVTFNNVTFTYAGNSTYKGLQHSGDLVYNDCTINGQVFLYGESETFNNCVFNTTDSNNYNVWTYGAKDVEFNGCTFNSAGKSVLVYNEAGPATELEVIDTDFFASGSVSGKAAIEIDTSAPNNPGAMDGTVITIDAATTATGFADDTISGSSLWNDKKVVDGQPNGGTTSVVVVAGATVKDSVDNAPAATYVAQVGDVEYTDLADAFATVNTANGGDVVIDLLVSEITLTEWTAVAWNSYSASGANNVTINGADGGTTIKGLNQPLFASTWTGGKLEFNGITISNADIVLDEDDSNAATGVGAFVGYIDSTEEIVLNNCHVTESTVKGGHWTGGLIGYSTGYSNQGDGPVFTTITINDCTVTDNEITGKGSVGGIVGHATGSDWTQFTITGSTVSTNTITSTGTSTNKAGSVIGTIGAAGQNEVAGKIGGVSVAVTTSGNTVTSNSVPITTVYGRQGSASGALEITGGSYDEYPIETGVAYAAPAEGYRIVENSGTYGVEVDPAHGKVAKIGETYYATLAEAFAAAQAGDTIVLLADVTLTETITLPAGVIFNGNGKTITGTIKAGGDLTFVGQTIVHTFNPGWYNNTITIGEDASLKVTSGRMTVSYGNTFNITGGLINAKTTDKSTITPSLELVGGISFNGDGGDVTFNVTNAYVKLGDSTTKNSGATGEFNMNFTNSIVDFTKTLKTYLPTADGLAPEFNMTAKDSVVSFASHLELWLDKTTVKLDNTDLTVGGSFANAGTVNVTNGSNFVVKAPIMSSHGGNTGSINITGGTFELVDSNEDWENAGEMTVSGDGVLKLNDFKNVNAGKVSIDASNMKAGDSITDRIVLNSEDTDLGYAQIQVIGKNLVVDDEGILDEVAVPVAKVGNTEYTVIDDAIAKWTNGTTLTLLADVTLSDVFRFPSTESRTLDLGTHTMTAAEGKHAIEITCNGQATATYGLTVKADAENPGGITATGKSCIYYRKSGTTKDRVIIRIDGGIFNGSYAINVYSSNRGTNCPQVSINGGVFNGNVNIGHGKLIAAGGVFNGWINCSGDSTAYRQISGGTYKSWQFMTADASNKFWVGTSLANYNVGLYVDDNGYLVVGGPVITEPGNFEASSTNYGGWSSYLQYSSAKDNGLYYTSVEEALADNNKTTGAVTVYTDEIDLTDLNYKGTLNIEDELTVTFAESTTPAWTVATTVEGKDVVYTDSVVDSVVTRTYKIVTAVAQIGETKYATLQAAIEAAQPGETITFLADITEDVTVSKSLTIDGGNFKYTGNISVSGNTTAAVVKNVKFVGGTGYAITTNRIKSITVENCTVTNYGFGFLYANKSTPTVVVKNVTVDGGNYGIHWAYGTTATLENVTMTNVTNGLYIQNYAGKTITLKNCNISSIAIWEKATAVQTFNFEGDNTVGTLSGNQYAKYVLGAADATLTAPDGSTVTTSVANSTVKYKDGKYVVVPVVAKIGEDGYETFAEALDAVQDGETITLLDVEGSEISKEIDFDKAITFTITGTAPNYALPVVTFQNATVNIENATILIPELDARQNATINVIDSIVHDAGGNSIVKSYYNGAIHISGTSVVHAMQVTTMGYITVSDAAKLTATWQTNVYGNGIITVEEDATFNTAALHLTGEDYSGRDNTDADRAGKPAQITVNGATLIVGKAFSDSGADYSYNSSKGINIGTMAGKKAVLDIKNGAKVEIYMANGETANIGAGGTVNVDASSLTLACRAADGNVVLTNNGTVYVSGTSDIAANVTGSGWVYMNGVNLDADTKLNGAKVAFINGTNTIVGSTIENGWFSVGVGQNDAAAAAAAFAAANGITLGDVTVNVSGNAVIGANGATYSGWIGSAYSADKTQHKYTLNVENSLAAFGYMHVSKDGELNVTGHATNKYTNDNANVDFYAGDLIVNGAVTLNGTDAWVKFTKMSADHADGALNIVNGTNFESSIHNGSNTSTSLKFWKAGEINVDETSKVEIDNGTVLVDGAKLNIAGAVTAKGTVTNAGTIVLTDKAATLTAAEGLTVESGVDGYEVKYADGKYTLAEKVVVGTIKLADKGRSLLFKDIIQIRYYFVVDGFEGVTNIAENSGLLVWTADEYAAMSTHDITTAPFKQEGLVRSGSEYYGTSSGIPAKNMGDLQYAIAYVKDATGNYVYSEVVEFSPLMYAELILAPESTSKDSMKELAVSMLNYGAAAQLRFNYKTDALMNSGLTPEQQNIGWNQDMLEELPADTDGKFKFAVDNRITRDSASLTFVGAINHNFYMDITDDLTNGSQKIGMLYWTDEQYAAVDELTAENASGDLEMSVVSGEPGTYRTVIEGTAAKDLKRVFYTCTYVVDANGEYHYGPLVIDSAHDYARRVLASSSTSDAMKNLAKSVIVYNLKAEAHLK